MTQPRSEIQERREIIAKLIHLLGGRKKNSRHAQKRQLSLQPTSVLLAMLDTARTAERTKTTRQGDRQ